MSEEAMSEWRFDPDHEPPSGCVCCQRPFARDDLVIERPVSNWRLEGIVVTAIVCEDCQEHGQVCRPPERIAGVQVTDHRDPAGDRFIESE